jgi:hypothetical protein
MLGIAMKYRVDVLTPLEAYIPYTTMRGVDRAFANSLAEHLRRHGAGGRIVCSGGIVDEWPRTYAPAIDETRNRVQQLREQAGF